MSLEKGGFLTNAVFGGSRVYAFLVSNIPLFIYLPQPEKDRQITPSTCTQLLEVLQDLPELTISLFHIRENKRVPPAFWANRA